MKTKNFLWQNIAACFTILCLIFSVGCTKPGGDEPENQDPNSSVFLDSRDGNSYRVIKIGSQTWMAENLRYLPMISDTLEYSPTKEFYSVEGYSGNNVNEAKKTDYFNIYGVAYNWKAAINACPPGWHIPTQKEWEQLINYCGGYQKAGRKLKSKNEVIWKNYDYSTTNDYGFSAHPGGVLPFILNSGTAGNFWNSQDPNYNGGQEQFGITFMDERESAITAITSDRLNEGCISIRCIKD